MLGRVLHVLTNLLAVFSFYNLQILFFDKLSLVIHARADALTDRYTDTQTQTDRQREIYSHSFRITYEKSAVRLLESREKRYSKATYNGGRRRFHAHVDTHDMAFPLSASDTVPLTYQRLQLSVSRDV